MNHNRPTNGFKKGHKKIEGSGRKPGQQNRVSDDLKQALLNAAMRVGFIHEEDILGEDGKPTGQTRKTYNGEGGLEGYLMSAAVNQSAHFLSLLGRVMLRVASSSPRCRVLQMSPSDREHIKGPQDGRSAAALAPLVNAAIAPAAWQKWRRYAVPRRA